jgi:hypothetical protein
MASQTRSNQDKVQQPVARPTAAVVSGNQESPQHKAHCSASPFQKAVKRDAKLRLAITGPSGAGKTYTLLQLAVALGKPVAVIDTERGSARKYADLFDFDVLELDSFDPQKLIQLIDQASDAGYAVLCIDSLSHFWMGKDGELDRVDRISRAAGNSFAGWKQVTPLHNALIDKLISAPLHILASMRSKTDWVLERDDKTGKTVPRKVGLAPVMRDGIEYEFDVFGDMDQENTLVITKTRCPKLSGAVIQKPGTGLAEVLKEWLAVDAPPTLLTPPAASVSPSEIAAIAAEPSNLVASVAVAREIPQLTVPDIGAMWKRMCTPRRVVEEFDRLRTMVVELAGSPGVAEYARILRECGAERPQDFKTSQTARLCAQRVCEWIEGLKAGGSRLNDGVKPSEGESPDSVVTDAMNGNGRGTGEAHVL